MLEYHVKDCLKAASPAALSLAYQRLPLLLPRVVACKRLMLEFEESLLPSWYGRMSSVVRYPPMFSISHCPPPSPPSFPSTSVHVDWDAPKRAAWREKVKLAGTLHLTEPPCIHGSHSSFFFVCSNYGADFRFILLPRVCNNSSRETWIFLFSFDAESLLNKVCTSPTLKKTVYHPFAYSFHPSHCVYNRYALNSASIAWRVICLDQSVSGPAGMCFIHSLLTINQHFPFPPWGF